jgi:branched-chain amino acid transport system permease protein
MSGAFIGLAAIEKLGLPLWLAFIIGTLGAGVLSVALEFVAFRPLRQRNAARISQLISSIGAALLIVNLSQILFQQLFGETLRGMPRELIPTDPIVIDSLGLRITPIRLIIIFVAFILMVLLQYMVTQTRLGRAMRAVAYNQRTASLLGINVGYIFVLTFFLAGVLGGAAGMLFGFVFINVTPFIGQDIALVGLTAIVLGGLGSIQGAVVGGFIVAALQTFSTAAGGSGYRDAIVFILLFLALLVRPQGLLGQPEQTRA